MTISVYLANKLNDHVLRNQVYTPPTSVWVALFSANTGLDANAPTGEIAVFAYARVEVGGASGRNFSVSAAKSSNNEQVIEFAAASGGNWGTVTHAAIVDHGTNTTWGTDVNVLFWGSLTAARTINNGQVFRFLAGELESLFS